MKTFEVTLFIMGVPPSPYTNEKVLIEAETQDEAEQEAHDRYFPKGYGVLESHPVRKGLTQEQCEGVLSRIDYTLSYVIPDNIDRGAVVDSVIDAVIQDIEETAVWSEFADDDYCEGDIDIALARVLYNKIVGE
jgi:hypothetical protein